MRTKQKSQKSWIASARKYDQLTYSRGMIDLLSTVLLNLEPIDQMHADSVSINKLEMITYDNIHVLLFLAQKWIWIKSLKIFASCKLTTLRFLVFFRFLNLKLEQILNCRILISRPVRFDLNVSVNSVRFSPLKHASLQGQAFRHRDFEVNWINFLMQR